MYAARGKLISATASLSRLLTLGKISFTTPPLISQRFASVASYQFYSLLPSISELVTYIQRKLCPSSDAECQNHASSLLSADYLDIDYDRISHALTVSAYWAKSPEGNGWIADVRKGELGMEKIEVGLLSSQPATEPEELSVAGLLAVIGEDDHPRMFRVILAEDGLLTFSQMAPCSLSRRDIIRYRRLRTIQSHSWHQPVFIRR